MLTGRYRYSKWRWRVLVYVIDALGAAFMLLWRLFCPARPIGIPRRILLVQLDHLGDAVLSTPLVAGLRAAYPNASIDVLASSSNRAVFEADPEIRQVHVADRNWFERRPAGWASGSAVWNQGRRLRRFRYDLGIDVRGDILSIAVLALAGIPRRVGWSMGGGGFLLTDVASWMPNRHEVKSRLALLNCLGVPQPDPSLVRVSVSVTDAERTEVAQRWIEEWAANRASVRASRVRVAKPVGLSTHPRPGRPQSSNLPRPTHRIESIPTDPDSLHAGRFGSEAPLLAVHLGAGTAAKRWPLRHWKTLVQRFLNDGWRVIVVGGPDEAGLRLNLDHPALRDWTGRLSVTQTTALLERADLFLGADSGPAHLAAAAGTPSVILFSGTNRIVQWRPWSRRALVLRHKVPCAPCHRKVCPLADHPCLTGLTPDRVHRAAQRWWSRLHHRE